MESLREQIEYGGHCSPHGTAIGTPGGADLMCGLCEQGLTRWVPEVRYELTWRDDTRGWWTYTNKPWTVDQIESVGLPIVEFWLGLLAQAEGEYEMLVQVSSTGYWDEEE